jgi:hypothetical protein
MKYKVNYFENFRDYISEMFSEILLFYFRMFSEFVRVRRSLKDPMVVVILGVGFWKVVV